MSVDSFVIVFVIISRLCCCLQHPTTERGDLLIFMSGMAEIESVVEAANEYATKTQKWIILPLHSSLAIEDQDKVRSLLPCSIYIVI